MLECIQIASMSEKTGLVFLRHTTYMFAMPSLLLRMAEVSLFLIFLDTLASIKFFLFFFVFCHFLDVLGFLSAYPSWCHAIEATRRHYDSFLFSTVFILFLC